jgi:hypothetical protein
MILQIDFLDHAQGIDQAVPCRVYGRLVREDETVVVVEYWTTTDEELRGKVDEDDYFTVVKSAITGRWTLQAVPAPLEAPRVPSEGPTLA